MPLTDRKFYISRDIVFHEDVFPFAQQKSNSQVLPVPNIDMIYDPPLSHVPVTGTTIAPADSATVRLNDALPAPILSPPTDLKGHIDSLVI